jgi:hypothetical protein
MPNKTLKQEEGRGGEQDEEYSQRQDTEPGGPKARYVHIHI